MTDIATYALIILAFVTLFGFVLLALRFLQQRRLRSAAGEIERLEGSAARDLERSELPEDEPDLRRHSALSQTPYLAWVLTALQILLLFLLVFVEKLIVPYGVPPLGTTAAHAYRAPSTFELGDRQYAAGQLLVERGQRILVADQRLIRQALARRGSVRGLRVVGTVVLLAAFFFVLLHQINLLDPGGIEKNRNLVLIYLVQLVVFGCAHLAFFYDYFSPYLVPLPWAGMVIAVLVNRRIVPLAVVTVLLVLVIDASLTSTQFLVLLGGGMVSGSWVHRARKRSEVIVASLLVGLAMTGLYLCADMIFNNRFEPLEPSVMAAFSGGVLSGVLMLIALPLFEALFDFTSSFRLLELLNLDTPVLKEFFFKAPGSYQHSLVVANVAESVANEIGANGLLVRVGAYYHDIGKMFNPKYFIENQTGTNPHDKLGTVASAAVLRSHVILGVRLARRLGLPGAVIDLIPQHHGTSTIDYFYFKSRSQQGIKSERVFKYPGPRPQSREAAILMLVDSTEAAMRVMTSGSPDEIRKAIRKIVERKQEQRQLDRSGLTVGELQQIVGVLTHIFKSAGHRRVSYPSSVGVASAPESEEEKETP